MAITLQKIAAWERKKKSGKLIKALSLSDLEIRIAAIKSLGVINDETALNTLIACLRDPELSIRANAAEALGNMANPRALEFLRYAATHDEDKTVRDIAAQGLNHIKENMPKEET